MSSASGCSVGGRGEDGSFPRVKMHDTAICVMCSMENGESDLKDNFRIFSRTQSAEMYLFSIHSISLIKWMKYSIK